MWAQKLELKQAQSEVTLHEGTLGFQPEGSLVILSEAVPTQHAAKKNVVQPNRFDKLLPIRDIH